VVRAQNHSITVREIDRVVRQPPPFDLARTARKQIGDIARGADVSEAIPKLLGYFETELAFCFGLTLAKRAERFC